MITYERAHELFYYNDKDLIWKISINNRAPKDSLAGCIKSTGYRQIRVDNKIYLAHRLIWLYQKGYMPENDLDHINRNRTDNRIENLREVSKSCNSRNCGNFNSNTSNIKGVCFHKNRGKWISQIGMGVKNYYLGIFENFDEAVLHRLAAEQCLGWDKCDKSSPAHKYAIDNKLIRPPTW